MKKPGYIPSCLLVLAFLVAGAVGEAVESPATTVPQEPSAEQTPPEPAATEQPGETSKEEELPQSDVVIDRLAGEVNIGPDTVVKRVRLLAGEVKIEGEVVEDVEVLAGEIDVRGRVYERVELLAGEVRVSGRVGPGGVHLKFGEVMVSGVVEGPVNVKVGQVTVTDEGVIQGDVTVEHGELLGPIEQAEGAIGVRSGEGWDWSRPFIAFIGLMTLIGLAAMILILAVVFRNTIQRGADLMEKEHLAWNLLWGGLAILLFVPIFVLLCVTVIGIPVAFLLFFLYPVAWLFGLILLANYLGEWILISVIKGESNFLVATILGIILLGVSVAVPLFGSIVMLVYTLLAIGISFRLMFGYFQNRRKPPAPPEVPEAAATA